MKHFKLIGIYWGMLLLLITSCTKDNILELESDTAVTGVEILTEATGVVLNSTLQLAALITPESAINKEVIWTSSNEELATVDEDGLVTGIALGEVIITATSNDNGEVLGSILISVTNDTANEVTSFVIDDVEATITENTITLQYPFGADVSGLTPTITHTGVQISPENNTPQDFTNPVNYLVISENEDINEYTVVVEYTDTPLSGSEFITTWSGTEFTIPINEVYTYNYNIDADNDGVIDISGITQSHTLTFEDEGPHTIRISGNFPAISFLTYFTERPKLIAIDQWGTNRWKSMNYAFFACTNVEILATDFPDLSETTNLAYMFYNADNANPDTSDWDTSNVANMEFIFGLNDIATPDTSNWDTSNVTNMRRMFYFATLANPDTSNWDTSNVTNMSEMFRNASVANPDTSNWDTSNVTTMSSMFNNAISAQNIDTGSWDISKVTTMGSMFLGVTLDSDVYDQILIDFVSKTRQDNVSFHGGNSEYCSASAAGSRADLISISNWNIIDGGSCE